MKIGNSNITRRSLLKSNKNIFSLVSVRIRNRKKLLKFYINSKQPSLSCLRKIGQNHGIIECVSCNRADEAQNYWFFSCASSQNIFIYLLCLLEYIDITTSLITR